MAVIVAKTCSHLIDCDQQYPPLKQSFAVADQVGLQLGASLQLLLHPVPRLGRNLRFLPLGWFATGPLRFHMRGITSRCGGCAGGVL